MPSDEAKLIEVADIVASVLLILSGLFYGVAGVFRVDVLSYINNPTLIRIAAVFFGLSSLYVGARLLDKQIMKGKDPLKFSRPGLLG